MSKKYFFSRSTIRKKLRNIDKTVVFLYGRLAHKNKAVDYCTLHKCYLEPKDIKEKRCNLKKCNWLKEVKK